MRLTLGLSLTITKYISIFWKSWPCIYITPGVRSVSSKHLFFTFPSLLASSWTSALYIQKLSIFSINWSSNQTIDLPFNSSLKIQFRMDARTAARSELESEPLQHTSPQAPGPEIRNTLILRLLSVGSSNSYYSNRLLTRVCMRRLSLDLFNKMLIKLSA